jgi:predicted outer membrane repeat protein
MLITQRITLLKKVAFVLGIWILAQLAPGYLSTAAASTCPENTSCVTRYDDNVDSDGLNGLNLRQAVGDTATSAVFIGATSAVTISLTTPLEIRKDISISAQVNSEGQNLVTIRPSESFDVTPESRSLIQIFAESATANVTISNVIVNGTIQDTETVRAIEVIENPIETSTVPLLKIESSTIQNSGAGSDGGAVLTPGDITVSHSTFTNNSADEYGGAIYAGGEIRVEKSTFTSNTAGDAGGAIATHSGETITVTNSAFQSNVATGISGHLYAGGGAIKGGDGLLQVDGSNFSENISNLDGGAILHFGDIEVTDSVFEDNEARSIDYGDGIANGSGGAILAISEENTELVSVSIDSSEFLRNKSAGDGGAIKVQGRIEVSQSSFLENEASGDGGAIDIDALEDFSGDETTSRISSSDFRSNDASGGDGGALDGSDYVLIIEESQFLYNYADDDGGAIWSGGLVRVLDSDFNENTADDDGGAIYADSIQINQSLFLENEAFDDGGAINVRNNDDQDVLSAILNTEFNGNVSMSGQGNALYGNAWLLLNSFVNYRTRGGVSAIALETNFSSVSIGNSFVEQNLEVAGDDFCAIGFDYSANNFASDSSCLGNFEADPLKSRVASSSVDSDGYLAFSDNIFNGETGLLAFDSNPDLLSAFINTALGDLEELHGRLPREDEIAEYESIPERRYAAQLDCWYDGISGADYYACGQEVYAEYQVEEDLYLETFGDVTELNLILEDVNDLDGHQFIGQYLSVDQNYFDRAVLSTWTAGAVHTEPKPVVVSNSNRSISLIKSNGFSSLEEQKLRAEKAALAEAEKKAAKSLRLAAVEKRRALTAQMRAKMAQTQMRGEMLKLKKQWQNLMKNFK